MGKTLYPIQLRVFRHINVLIVSLISTLEAHISETRADMQKLIRRTLDTIVESICIKN